nr:hypothetical protein [bacterium]
MKNKIDGKDLQRVIINGEKPPHETLFWGLGDQRAVRRGKWKLILNPQLDFSQKADEAVCLYDLESDPGETANLAHLQPGIVEELKKQITAWETDWKTEAAG